MKKIAFLLLSIIFVFALFSCGKTSVEISEDGYWVIDGEKTNVLAKGEKGDKGDKGDTGAQGEKGDKGDTGATGATAPAPTIEISEDGFWVINGVKTDVLATDDNPQGLDFFLKGDGTYAVGLGNSIYLSEVEIPSTYNGKPVTEIMMSTTLFITEALEGGCKIKKITIPDSVTSIGDSAFKYCENLESITLPDGVTSIGEKAFMYCENLESITLPEGVTSIGYGAFSSCESLADVYYMGTEAQWAEVSIGGGDNQNLTNATMHYNYTAQ